MHLIINIKEKTIEWIIFIMETFRQLLLTSSAQMNQIYIRKQIVNVTIRLYKKHKRKEKRKKNGIHIR